MMWNNMRVVIFSTLAIFLTVSDEVLPYKLPRGTPQDRNIFSRFANSRFPFFTVDLARFQDTDPSSGRKRSIEIPDSDFVDRDMTDNAMNLIGTDKNVPKDVAEAFGIFNSKHVGDLDIITEQFSGYEDAPIDVPLPSAGKRSDLRKRIHTCAFMRRLGVPIGLCFSNLRRLNEENKNKGQIQRQSARNPYQYLERQVQGHTMLGGGVGR